jgi:hypothetical protein
MTPRQSRKRVIDDLIGICDCTKALKKIDASLCFQYGIIPNCASEVPNIMDESSASPRMTFCRNRRWQPGLEDAFSRPRR